MNETHLQRNEEKCLLFLIGLSICCPQFFADVLRQFRSSKSTKISVEVKVISNFACLGQNLIYRTGSCFRRKKAFLSQTFFLQAICTRLPFCVDLSSQHCVCFTTSTGFTIYATTATAAATTATAATTTTTVLTCC